MAVDAIQRPIEKAKGVVASLRERYAAVDITFATFEAFGEDDGASYAAALTYYTFFSIFPLLLLAIAILGYLTFNDQQLQEDLFDAGVDAVPMIKDALQNPSIFEDIAERRGELAASGIALALYTGSGAIVALEHALNVMLDVPRDREPGWLQKRLRSLRWLAVLGAGTLVALALGGTATFFAETFDLEENSVPAKIVTHLFAFPVGVLLFATAYKFLPAKKQEWRQVLPGAVLAALLFEVLKEVGGWYLQRGAAAREATFGALASVAALLIASYLMSQIVLLCAELNGVLRERGLTSGSSRTSNEGGSQHG